MGKPSGGNAPLTESESNRASSPTQGSETSQYLEEKKTTVIPSVVASERGTAQTNALVRWGCGIPTWDLRRIEEACGKKLHRG